MSEDQAQGLRDLMGLQGYGGSHMNTVFTHIPKAQNPEAKQTPTEPDYRALWDKLRTRLLARASERTLLNFHTEGALQAMAILNVMTTLEAQ